MARLRDVPPFFGSRHGVFVWTRWENNYIRAKSSLTGERVKTAPAFKKIMQNAGLLSRASKMASAVYSRLAEKEFQLYRQLTGQAIKMLKAGMNELEVSERLLQYCGKG